ncbi:MAG TPA: HAMP domain-containing sensor histidine kinase [Myxococcota bacterium]|nr:HAMP domain-containing sensor histidine kinase [Myxococcota bacterium]
MLRWLVPLRFIAATGQAVALLGAKFLLDLPLPYGSLALVPAVTALSNIALRRLTVEPGRARSLAGSALVLDTVLFTLLLQQSGGPDNPFSALYAIHVAMAAMLGSARVTWLVAALSAGGYACLFHWHEPQHFWHGPIVAGSSLQLHAVGMWLAVVIVAVVITFFIGRVTETLRLREAELRRISELAARNARLAALTTLAAGAAHELGSPLGTIAVIARDIEREAQSGLPLAEDARLLRSEVARCRAILDRMSGRAAQAAQGDDEPLLGRDVAALFSSAAFGEAAQRVVTELDASLDASLGGRADFAALVLPLVRNALDASSPDGSVRVSVSRTDGRVRVSVRDEGHGMSEQVLERAGEPFFTTRPPGRGTGLGLFVARLHAERLGGTLALDSAPGQGTSATAEWPAPYERA